MKLARRLQTLPIRVALVYWGFASLWILFSDSFLLLVGLDSSRYAWLSMAKGLGFVGISGLLCYVLLRRNVAVILSHQDELVRTEARLRRRMESLPHGVLEVDATGRIAFCNTAASRLLGHAPETVERMQLADIATDPSSRALVRRYQRDWAGGDSRSGAFVLRISRADGDIRDLDISWTEDSLSGGAGRASIVVLTDITDRLAAEQSRRRLAAVLEATSDLVAMVTPDGRVLYLNQAGRRMLGLSDDMPLEAIQVNAHMPPGIRRWLLSDALVVAAETGIWSGEAAVRQVDGSELPVSAVIIAHADGEGSILHYAVMLRDVSERRRSDEALRTSREQYRVLVENTQEGLAVAQDGRVRFVNPRLVRLLGYAEHTYYRRRWLEFVHADDRSRVLEWYRQRRCAPSATGTCRFRLIGRDGQPCWVETKAVEIEWEGQAATLSFFTDISGQMEAQSRLDYLADYDELTGLPNRQRFLQTLGRAIEGVEETTDRPAVVYVDLSRFQLFNDSHGHAVGDQLIRIAANRLAAEAGRDDMVARVAGDEFALLLQGGDEPDALTRRVRHLLARLADSIQLGGNEFYLSARAGISLYPADGDNAALLLRNAASALDLARESGSGTCQFYAAALNERARNRLAMETDLRHALGRGEFFLLWQPQADLATGRILGAEALLRWQHPDRGLISPAEFIPVLENSGLILPVGRWVLEQACLQQSRWQRELGLNLRVSINLSPRQLTQGDLPEIMVQVLAQTGASSDCIELEITESSLIRDPAAAATRLEALKATGISIAVDDFGTGYSSLAYFRRFPVDSLKIDKSFVAEVTHNVDAAEIARTIVGMGRNLGMRVIAEGVETPGQLQFLRRQGCDWMQGFLLGRPMLPGDFGEMARSNVHLPGLGWDEMAPRVVVLAAPEVDVSVIASVATDLALAVYRVDDHEEAMESLSADRVFLLAIEASACREPVDVVVATVRALYPWVSVVQLKPVAGAREVVDADASTLGLPLRADAVDRLLRRTIRQHQPLMDRSRKA